MFFENSFNESGAPFFGFLAFEFFIDLKSFSAFFSQDL